MYISIHAYFGHAIYYSAANIEYDYLWTVLVGYPIGCSSMPGQRMFWQQEQHDGIDFGRVFVHAHDRQIISFIIDIFISPHSHRPRPFDLSICCLASNECNTLWRLVFRWNVYACIYMFAIFMQTLPPKFIIAIMLQTLVGRYSRNTARLQRCFVLLYLKHIWRFVLLQLFHNNQRDTASRQ